MPLLCIMIQPRQGVYGEYGQSGWVVWCGDGSYALVWLAGCRRHRVESGGCLWGDAVAALGKAAAAVRRA